MKAIALMCCALAFSGAGRCQKDDMEHQAFQVGAINYFGYGDLPLDKVRAALPLHVGDTLTQATFSKQPTMEAVTSVIGKPPTDVNVTCCIGAEKLEVFIGLPGSTSKAVPKASALTGDTRLDPEGMRLYQQMQPLLGQTVARGAGGEDDSQGYMISKDPALKAVNLAMRTYAMRREASLRHVLQTARDAEDRRAAAALLGYARRSRTQVEALSGAMNDPDEEVRNNAVRALEVLAASRAKNPVQISVEPLVRLLYSGVWTDRNKASLLLMRLTDARDPGMLASLRKEAMGPLVEGASWVDVPGHSTPFLVILARIGGITNDKLAELLTSGNNDAIIAAAISSDGRAVP